MTASGPQSSKIRFAGARQVDRGSEVGGDVLDPDRLEAPLAGPEHRSDRRPAHLADEQRQHAAVPAEDEARPEDHVLEPGLLDRLLHLPLRVVVGGQVLRVLADAERAHQDEPAHPGFLRRGDEVLRATGHHALERGARAGDDRNQVDDDVAAGDGSLQRCRVGDVAAGELAAPVGQLLGPVRLANQRADVTALHAQGMRDVPPTNPVPPVSRITRRNFSSSGSALVPAGPGTSIRGRCCRTATPRARRAGRTRAGRSSSRGRS